MKKTFKIKTKGISGENWIKRLEKKKYNVSDYAKQLLRGAKFVATNGVTYTLAMIMGDEFEYNDRTNQNIRAEAYKRGYLDPSVELGPYLREMFSDEDLKKMGLYALVLMHEPILDSDGVLHMLGANRIDLGRWLDTFYGTPGHRWDREVGFMFLVPASGTNPLKSKTSSLVTLDLDGKVIELDGSKYELKKIN